MAEDSHIIPLAPPQTYGRSDKQWAATTTQPKDHLHKHPRSSKCFVYTLTLLVLQSIAFLVFGLVFLRINDPKLKLGVVEIKNLRYGTTNNVSSLNMTMVAEIKLSNTNFGRFKFQDGSTSVLYGNETLGMAGITGGLVKGRKNDRMNVTVQVRANDDLAQNMNFSSDIGSNLVKLSSYAKLRGEVRVVKIITRHRTSFMNCSMTLNLTSQAIQNLLCM